MLLACARTSGTRNRATLTEPTKLISANAVSPYVTVVSRLNAAQVPIAHIVTAALVLSGSALALTAAIGVVRFPDTMSRMHAATKPQVLGLLLVLVGAAIRLRGNVDVGMLILTGIFTVITAPVVANRLGQLAYREQNLRDILTKDELGGANGEN